MRQAPVLGGGRRAGSCGQSNEQPRPGRAREFPGLPGDRTATQPVSPSRYRVMGVTVILKTVSRLLPQMEGYEPVPRTEWKRRSQRARRDRATVHAVFDDASQCRVDSVGEGPPVVIPAGFGLPGERLYLRGALRGCMLSTLAVQEQPPGGYRQSGSSQG